jgi:hypothetical protein
VGHGTPAAAGVPPLRSRKEVTQMTHVTLEELAYELSETLPAREALGLFNYANVVASNSSMALNAVTVNSVAVSGATQTIGVFQS